MPYADVTYYKNVYKGNIVPDSDIEKYLQRASDSVDIVTFMRLKDLSLGEFQETRVKMAVCYQADYLYQYENFLDLGAKGYSIGDVSVSLPYRLQKCCLL